MHNEPTLPHLIPVGDVAQMYGVSERSVWRMAKTGKIPPPVQFGTRVTRWRFHELFKHIEQLPPAGPSVAVEDDVPDANFNDFEFETIDEGYFGRPIQTNPHQGE